MDYGKMLEKAKKELPKNIEKKERFKLPYLKVEKEGKKTVIKNFKEVSNKLQRDIEHISKFLYKTTGASGYIDNGKLYLNSSVETKRLVQLLKDYADTYVICDECGKADTTMSKEGKITTIKCTACGAVKTMKGV